jgi:uncharacterized membrane protein YphA (DoxX/SURF4 family)
MKGLSRYAPLVLRLGLAAVFVWFGISQLTNSSLWIGMVPEWATSLLHIPANTIVYLNGWFEIVAGLLLALGLFVRLLGVVLAGHLFVITYELGMNPVGVRDFGLACSTFALALFGADDFSLSVYLRDRKKNTELNA